MTYNQHTEVCEDCPGRGFSIDGLIQHRRMKHGEAESVGVALRAARSLAEKTAARRERNRLAEEERARLAIYSSLTPREVGLVAALQAAQSHLDFIGYGDAYERECAEHSGLAEQIEAALASAGVK